MNAPAPFRSQSAGPFGRRQKRERGARIPVTVLTGFLGAGKTTLLQQYLKTPEGAGTAVVVNEVGAAGIDDALLRQSSDEVTLLGNGCVCCVTRTDLQIALRRLVSERAQGAIPDFRRVVIETSGLADPGPILQTFSTDRALGGEFHAELVVTVADAATGAATLERHPEARRQSMLADLIVITKTDLADPAPLQAALRVLNPRATFTTAKHGALDPALLAAGPTAERNPFSAEAAHSDGVGSFVWTENLPATWPVFARAMDTLLALRGPHLLRAKGFLNVEGCQGPVLVQYVQHLAHPPVELESWPDAARHSRVVFITRGIAEKQVRDLFAAVKALA